jgi:hypothetical protein
MTLDDLLCACRTERLDDAAEPFLWSDAELTGYLNDAQDEACRRARLIVDSSTPSICGFSVSSGTTFITVDPRVIFVRRVKLASRKKPLVFASYLELDQECQGWDERTGTVEAVITDVQSGKLRLYRIPTASDTGTLTVVRTALDPMAAASDEPEIAPRFHRSLIAWACYRAYIKQDADSANADKAAAALAEFEREFGPKSPAIDEIYQAMRQPFDGNDGRF